MLQKLKLVWLLVVVVGVIGVAEGRNGRNWYEDSSKYYGRGYSAISCRAHSASIRDFGGVGDGKTDNTRAFREAVNHLSQYGAHGGAELFVPAGKWLTGSFNLTSHFTLFLHKDAVLLASQDIHTWPLVDPLPSYGHGRDTSGGRYISLIFGSNLTDVVITGNFLLFFFCIPRGMKLIRWSLFELVVQYNNNGYILQFSLIVPR